MSKFYPDEEACTAYEIAYQKLYTQGYRGIIFDIDNTLVYPDAPADDASVAFVRDVKAMGYAVCIVSNNKEERVRRFAEAVGAQYVASALKPLTRGYKQAMENMGTTPQTTLCVGDQLFTDIWGARRLGIRAILTQPFTLQEEPQIRLKRLLEKPILRRYHKTQKKASR